MIWDLKYQDVHRLQGHRTKAGVVIVGNGSSDRLSCCATLDTYLVVAESRCSHFASALSPGPHDDCPC